MALLLDNNRIAGIDFHVTDYMDSDGVKRICWHKHARDNGRVHLINFKPETISQFIRESFALFNIKLKPGGSADANDGYLQLG